MQVIPYEHHITVVIEVASAHKKIPADFAATVHRHHPDHAPVAHVLF